MTPKNQNQGESFSARDIFVTQVNEGDAEKGGTLIQNNQSNVGFDNLNVNVPITNFDIDLHKFLGL
jgi:hypothetical protein